MKNKIVFLISFLLIVCQLNAQTFERIQFNEKNKEDYYLALKPQSGKITGALVLLPGFGGMPEDNFAETKLFNVGYVNDILTISLGEGQKIYADEQVIDQLNQVMADVVKRYSIPNDKFIIGGLSAGGTIAIRYVEYCMEQPSKAPIIPKGVFAVDSPLDLVRVWKSFQQEIKRNYSEIGVNEAKMVSALMRKDIGTPDSNPKRYAELTTFSYYSNEPGNERFLKNIPVRVYEDIGVEWQLKNRRRSLYDNNALDASELISRLLLMGNDQAEFVTSKQPGRRSNGMLHPHSWSIVDEAECIQWCLKLFSGNVNSQNSK